MPGIMVRPRKSTIVSPADPSPMSPAATIRSLSTTTVWDCLAAFSPSSRLTFLKMVRFILVPQFSIGPGSSRKGKSGLRRNASHCDLNPAVDDANRKHGQCRIREVGQAGARGEIEWSAVPRADDRSAADAAIIQSCALVRTAVADRDELAVGRDQQDAPAGQDT